MQLLRTFLNSLSEKWSSHHLVHKVVMKLSYLTYIKSSAAAAKSLQLCPTLCNPRDGSPPGSPIPGILQPRTLEWVAISFSNAWKWKVKVKLLSCVRLLVTPWTAAYQASSVHGIFKARVLEWGAIDFSQKIVNAWARLIPPTPPHSPMIPFFCLPVLWDEHTAQQKKLSQPNV